MRYTPGLPPITSVKEEEEPHPLRAIRAVRAVEPRTRVHQVAQRLRPRDRVREGEGLHGRFALERRADIGRRSWCRRMKHGNEFFDTRSDEERRRQQRRDSDIATTLDEKI